MPPPARFQKGDKVIRVVKRDGKVIRQPCVIVIVEEADDTDPARYTVKIIEEGREIGTVEHKLCWPHER